MVGPQRSRKVARTEKIIISDKDLVADPSEAIEILSDVEGSPLDETALAVVHIPDIDTLISGTELEMSTDAIDESILDVGISDSDVFSFLGEQTHIHTEADMEMGLGWHWNNPDRPSAFAVVPRADRTPQQAAPVSEEAVVPKQVTDCQSGDPGVLPILISLC